MDFERFLLTIMGLIFIIIGIYGILNFASFFKLYCEFMDTRNSLNINYPKGTYAKVVLKLTLGMCLIMGLVIFVCNIFIFMNILIVV